MHCHRNIKTIEGRATVSRNAFKGGKRPALRQSIAALKRYFRLNDEFLDDFPTVSKEQAVALLDIANKLLTTKNVEQLYEALA